MIEGLTEQLVTLAEITGKKYRKVDQIGVLAGQSGLALFQFYCAKHFEDDSYSNIGVEIIGNCMDKINEGYAFPTYCTGIAGFGWTLQHLKDNQFIELDLDELLCPFDDYLLAQMNFELGNGFYDFLHGAMGYGFYFLKRFLSSSTNKEVKKKYFGFLEGLVQELEKLALKDGDGLKWESVLNIEKGNKGVNLSLSHGMSSIVYLLARFYHAGVSKTRVKKLLSGAVNYIISFENTDKKNISRYPSWIAPKKPLAYNSRLAWCYGDIGVAMALERASNVLHDDQLCQRAENILFHTSTRRLPEQSMVVDPGFCHGSFGNAHMFHLFWLKKRQKIFQEAAQFWLKDGLERHSGISEEPFKQWNALDTSWQSELNLLEGISGIGLTLIDFLSEKENTWDECLMLR